MGDDVFDLSVFAVAHDVDTEEAEREAARERIFAAGREVNLETVKVEVIDYEGGPFGGASGLGGEGVAEVVVAGLFAPEPEPGHFVYRRRGLSKTFDFVGPTEKFTDE